MQFPAKIKKEAAAIQFTFASIILIFLFLFITGFHDEGNLIATIVSSRSMNIKAIFAIAFFSQIAGTFLLGTKVANSTVYGLLRVETIQQDAGEVPAMICAAVLGAAVWNIITWVSGIPSSSSHAVVGGLMGPFIVRYGFAVVNAKGMLFSILLPLFTSPVIGFLFGYLIYWVNRKLFNGCSIRVRSLFQGSQAATCVLINAFQGSNDAQKAMGIFALLLMAQNGSWSFSVPEPVVMLSALTIAAGLLLGGTRMIRSVGTKLYSVKRLHSMSAQTSSLIVIGLASVLGFPVSGTQIVNSAILGVGAADRPNAVGWLYAKEMLTAWLVTIPASFLISAGFYLIFHSIGG